jgi:hypothetical protein
VTDPRELNDFGTCDGDAHRMNTRVKLIFELPKIRQKNGKSTRPKNLVLLSSRTLITRCCNFPVLAPSKNNRRVTVGLLLGVRNLCIARPNNPTLVINGKFGRDRRPAGSDTTASGMSQSSYTSEPEYGSSSPSSAATVSIPLVCVKATWSVGLVVRSSRRPASASGDVSEACDRFHDESTSQRGTCRMPKNHNLLDHGSPRKYATYTIVAGLFIL